MTPHDSHDSGFLDALVAFFVIDALLKRGRRPRRTAGPATERFVRFAWNTLAVLLVFGAAAAFTEWAVPEPTLAALVAVAITVAVVAPLALLRRRIRQEVSRRRSAP